MPSFRHLLKTREQRRQYDRSNAVSSIPVRVSPRLRRAVELLEGCLDDAAHRERCGRAEIRRTQELAQIISDELCRALRVRLPNVKVKGKRPLNRTGELHGLFTTGPSREDCIQVWMLTAKRQQVVKFKTFLRTLVHEVCHHLDYVLLSLRDSFHTDGFFRRESSLVHQLLRRKTETQPPVGPPAIEWRLYQPGSGVLPVTVRADRGKRRIMFENGDDCS
jgi:hypothetical protein